MRPRLEPPNPADGWRTLRNLAPEFGRTIRCLEKWCVNGTFTEFGYEVYRQRGQWWVRVSPQQERKACVR